MCARSRVFVAITPVNTPGLSAVEPRRQSLQHEGSRVNIDLPQSVTRRHRNEHSSCTLERGTDGIWSGARTAGDTWKAHGSSYEKATAVSLAMRLVERLEVFSSLNGGSSAVLAMTLRLSERWLFGCLNGGSSAVLAMTLRLYEWYYGVRGNVGTATLYCSV